MEFFFFLFYKVVFFRGQSSRGLEERREPGESEKQSKASPLCLNFTEGLGMSSQGPKAKKCSKTHYGYLIVSCLTQILFVSITGRDVLYY